MKRFGFLNLCALGGDITVSYNHTNWAYPWFTFSESCSYVDGWTDMDGWIVGWMDMDRCVGGCMGWIDVGRWMDVDMGVDGLKWMDKWMDIDRGMGIYE